MRVLANSLLLLILLFAVPALAQVEPPARVGRVSLVSGTLAFFGPGDTIGRRPRSICRSLPARG
jgi:hypothetical protein